jgi:hypothetical protein
MSKKSKRSLREDETPIFIDLSYRSGRTDLTPIFTDTSQLMKKEEDEPFTDSLRFGEWLVRRGLISSKDLFAALHDSYQYALRIGDALVDLEVLDRKTIEQEARAHDDFMAFLAKSEGSESR